MRIINVNKKNGTKDRKTWWPPLLSSHIIKHSPITENYYLLERNIKGSLFNSQETKYSSLALQNKSPIPHKFFIQTLGMSRIPWSKARACIFNGYSPEILGAHEIMSPWGFFIMGGWLKSQQLEVLHLTSYHTGQEVRRSWVKSNFHNISVIPRSL